MKYFTEILSVTLILFNATPSSCQTDEKISYKYGVELNNSISLSSWSITPTFSFRELNNHTFDLGIGTSISDQWYWPPNPLNGIVLTAGYKLFPIGKQNKLNFYFHYSMKHYIFFAKQNGYYPTKNAHYNENFLGYGFEVPIGKRFYFNHDLGVGILTEWTTYQTDEKPNPSIYIDGAFRIGFGYKFGH